MNGSWLHSILDSRRVVRAVVTSCAVAAFTSTIARADIEGIPFNPDFPRASFPYAKAPDGCSSWDADHPEWVRDTWGPVSFKDTCDDHDRCYYTLGSDVNDCNDAFREGLRKACYDALCWHGICAPVVTETCYTIAAGYYAAVVGFQDTVFREAQEKQQAYLLWVDSVRMGTPAPTPNQPPGLDFGYADRRWLVDVNGDGKADFCRAVGNASGAGSFLGCSFSTTSAGAIDTRVAVADWGYSDRRWMVDVNGDGKADFCRAVGNGFGAGSFLGCSLSVTGSGAIDTRVAVADWGYSDRRWMVDTNGDGKADFCRAVGNGSGAGSYLGCSLSVTSSGALDTLADVADWGYSDRRWMVDVNSDGKADFCRAVGNGFGESSYFGCSLSVTSSGAIDTLVAVANWDVLRPFFPNRLYWQAGRHFRGGLLEGDGVDRALRVDMAYDGRVLDESDRLFAANGSRLYWQAGRHFRSGVLEGEGLDKALRMDMAYDGRVLDENDHLFAANGNRLYWQAGRHVRSGLLLGDGVDKELRMDMAYDGRVIDENDHLFAANGNRLYWQAGRHFRSGLLLGDGVDKELRMDMAYDGRVIDENDRLFAATLAAPAFQ